MDAMTDTTATIILCPGQGAQHVGMGKAWREVSPVAAEVFAQADDLLNMKLSALCFDGPEGELNRTDVAQAAIYVTSVACCRAMEDRGALGPLAATAGLSLGEFTALHLAGAIDFATGLRLVRLRGQAMQEAAEASQGGMVALIGAEESQAQALCEEARGGEVLVPANFNAPGQIVISGSSGACERSLQVAEKMGLRATPLKVAGAFHSPLMQPAAERLSQALEEATWRTPRVPVVSNVTARPHEADAASIRGLLVSQLTHPVRWAESMAWLTEQVSGRYVEVAPNKVLAGLMRRINRAVKVENFAEPD